MWDSEIFPEQNGAQQTRLCVIMRESPDPLKTALEALQKHLGITKEPNAHLITEAKECIPQLTVGHHKRTYEGVCTIGVNNCIAHAKEIGINLDKNFRRRCPFPVNVSSCLSKEYLYRYT